MKGRARRLRKNMTDAEQALWKYLRMRQMAGAKFRQQQPIGPYIVHFGVLREQTRCRGRRGTAYPASGL